MYYKIEIINNLNIDCYHRHPDMLLALYKCWSFLAARKYKIWQIQISENSTYLNDQK